MYYMIYYIALYTSCD